MNSQETYVSDEISEIFGIETSLNFIFIGMSVSRWADFVNDRILIKWLEGSGYHIRSIEHIENSIAGNRVVFNHSFDLESFIDGLETEKKWKTKEEKDSAIVCQVCDEEYGYYVIQQEGEWRLCRQNKFSKWNSRLTSGTSGISGFNGTSGISGMSGTSGGAGLAGSSAHSVTKRINGSRISSLVQRIKTIWNQP